MTNSTTIEIVIDRNALPQIYALTLHLQSLIFGIQRDCAFPSDTVTLMLMELLSGTPVQVKVFVALLIESPDGASLFRKKEIVSPSF